MLGFAVFNKHPASIFLGDAGSLPIGLCLAFLLIFVAETNLVAALLLSLYTLADSISTFLRRLLAGERVFAAHRTHFYQRAVAAGLSVPQVTARVFVLGLLLASLAIGTVLAELACRRSSMPRPRPRGHLLHAIRARARPLR